jgi:hypothetical protein
LAAIAMAMLAGCAAGAPPAQVQPEPPASGPFADIDRSARALVNQEASWHAPQSLTVDKTERIGLSVGTGSGLKNKIDNLLPATTTTSAGPVQVGPTMRATLRANPADAEITPSDAVNASTGTDIQMLWTWLVHPKRPTKALQLTAFLEVPLDNGHTISNEIAFSIPVQRTFVYTAEEVATHWATWSAVAATLVSVTGWFLRRRNRRRKAAAAAAAQVVSG